jgi:peptidoglycan hydrolase CwlO-like protein
LLRKSDGGRTYAQNEVITGTVMALVNPNDVAANGIRVLQAAIDRLDGLKQQATADVTQIDTQIDALQSQQAALRDQALGTIEDSDSNQQAITAMNAATAALNAESANMRVTAAGLTGVSKLVTAAASLVTALARFA